MAEISPRLSRFAEAIKKLLAVDERALREAFQRLPTGMSVRVESIRPIAEKYHVDTDDLAFVSSFIVGTSVGEGRSIPSIIERVAKAGEITPEQQVAVQDKMRRILAENSVQIDRMAVVARQLSALSRIGPTAMDMEIEYFTFGTGEESPLVFPAAKVAIELTTDSSTEDEPLRFLATREFLIDLIDKLKLAVDRLEQLDAGGAR